MKDMTDGVQHVPAAMRMVMIFIDRIGFPILAFILMFYIAYASTEKMSRIISENTVAMIKFSESFEAFQQQVLSDHRELMRKMDLLSNEH